MSRYWRPEFDRICHREAIEIPFLVDALDEWDLYQCRKLLDIGCGMGPLVNHWRINGLQAEGITYLAEEAVIAKERYGIDLVVGDMHDLPWDDGVFDGIVFWDSLEHAISPYIALCEARRVTRKNGRGLIFMPGHLWQYDRYHVLLPTMAQMSQLLWLSGWTLYRSIDLSHASQKGFRQQKNMALYFIVNDDHERDYDLKFADYERPARDPEVVKEALEGATTGLGQ